MITVTKVFHFCYGHSLPEYQGLCKNIHGHNSRVEVEFQRSGHNNFVYPGMVVDFTAIKNEIGKIINDLDHCYLNDHPDLFHFFYNEAYDLDGLPFPPTSKVIPTAEVICQYLVHRIQRDCSHLSLVRLRISETDDSWAEWRLDR